MRILAFALLSAALMGVTGCGGHDDDVPPSPPPQASGDVPASALASSTAFTTYVGQRPVDDTAEPLDLADLMPPTTETDEPEDI